MNRKLQRRTFLRSTAGGAIVGYLSGTITSAATTSPNSRLNIAAIGATGRAGANIQGCQSENIVAIADIDANLLEKGSQPYPNARKYRDYREMLEQEADNIDAVLVGTPDHSHAPAAAMALRLKKHVYCEKPLTHTVLEARTLARLAKENNLVTQMGTQIHSLENYRRAVEIVESGVIGPVRECHVWANAIYTGGHFTTNTSAPQNVDWDLWLGPAPQRPYSEGVHPFHWRRFWDYGTGSLGDFGCHFMDLPHWALKLRNPTSISAIGSSCDPVTTPGWCVVDYRYPARENLPPVQLTWYDSGMKPAQLAQLVRQQPKDQNGNDMNTDSGQMFVGEHGMLLTNYTQRCLLPADKFADVKLPDPYIPNSIGHHEEWIHAIKNGGSTTCNFDYSGALTESVLLGTVSFRSGQRLEWDPAQCRVTNSDRAQQFVHKEYRKGWSL